MKEFKVKAGKLTPDTLKELIFAKLGASDSSVILGPKVGEDAAVVDLQDKVLVLTTDPITGAVKDLGRLAVHINANDVATRGVMPKYFLVTILLPSNTQRDILEQIMTQMDLAAKELGISIIGGHTEVTPVVNQPVIVGAMIGIALDKKFVTCSNAKPGNKIILTKYAGIEGTTILAEDCKDYLISKGVTQELLSEAYSFKKYISVVKDAEIAMKTGKVTAMHDPTEGGILGGICEIAEASELGVRIFEERIVIKESTKKIAEVFKIDPLFLISSGTMVIAVKEGEENTVVQALRKAGIEANVVGEFTSNRGVYELITQEGKIKKIDWPRQDELWAALEKCRGE